MSKCGHGSNGAKSGASGASAGGGGNPAIAKYGPGGPAPKKTYSREGAAPFKAFLYDSDVSAAPRGYAADPMGRYRLPYTSRSPALYRARTTMERYTPPHKLPLLPLKAHVPESDTFRKLVESYRPQDIKKDPYTHSLLQPQRSLVDELEERENRRRKNQMNL